MAGSRTAARFDHGTARARTPSIRYDASGEFAFLDALARVILHCLPEPQAEIRDQAMAKAKERHQKL